MNIKNEIYNQNIFHLNRKHNEEIKKIRIQYENKFEDLIKQQEEEKLELHKKISTIEKDNLLKYSKLEVNDKSEMIEFQKKYLNEMRVLQKNFEDFKFKTYEEFNILKKKEEEALYKANFYKENFEKLKDSSEQTENLYKSNYLALKCKLENFKSVIKNNEVLKNQLELSKSEINFLKMKISKLESVQGYFFNNDNIEINYYTEPELARSSFLNPTPLNNKSKDKSSEIVNYDNFPNFLSPNAYKKFPGIQFNDTETLIGKEEPANKSNKIYNMDTLDENLYKVIDLKKAHLKIKEMEECLRSMNDENESLKEKLEYACSYKIQENRDHDQDNLALKNLSPEKKIGHDEEYKCDDSLNNIPFSQQTITYDQEILKNNLPPTPSVKNLYNFTKSNQSTPICHDIKKGLSFSKTSSEDGKNVYQKNNFSEPSPPLNSVQSATFFKPEKKISENSHKKYSNIYNKKSSNQEFIDIPHSGHYSYKLESNHKGNSIYSTEVPSGSGKDKIKNENFKTKNNCNFGNNLQKTLNFQPLNNTSNNSQEFNYECMSRQSNENDTSNDNIIEFPLQLKIKGKLKKMTSNSNKI